MLLNRISDFDDAYANGAHIVGGEAWVDRWKERAAAFRAGHPDRLQRRAVPYGHSPRQVFDLFLPEAASQGLVVFVHGGYWLRNDGAMWSHLARGPLARGRAVVIPTYRLCPEARIGEIVAEVAEAIATAAGLVDGPIVLSGHSAGGQIVSRMICRDSPLLASIVGRVARVVSISGVHDLRPLLRTAMKSPLRLDEEEARRESPALNEPIDGARLVCWVGGAERAEFRRQNALLASVWTGLGAATCAYEAPDRHHFDVIEALADPQSDLTRVVCED
jgi:acetyl esterase/lipase